MSGTSEAPRQRAPFSNGEQFPAWAWVIVVALCVAFLWLRWISADIFFGVLLGSVLGHTSATAIARRSESQQQQAEADRADQMRLQERTRRYERQRQAVSLIIAELHSNLSLIERLRKYPNEVYSGTSDFIYNRRKSDPFLERFSDSWYQAARRDASDAVADVSLLVEIDTLYRDLRHINGTLRHVEEFIYTYDSAAEMKDPARRYQEAVGSLSWRPVWSLCQNCLAPAEAQSKSLIVRCGAALAALPKPV